MNNRESTLAELRSIWGSSFDEKMAAARIDGLAGFVAPADRFLPSYRI